MSINTEVILKTLVIIGMIVLLSLQIILGVGVNYGYFKPEFMSSHYSFALFLLFLIPIHIFFRYKKLMTLLKEFIKVLLGGNAELHSKADLLVDTFKDKSFSEFCKLYNFNEEEARFFLETKGHVVINDESLENFSIREQQDLFKLFLKLVDNLKQNK